MKIFYNPGPAIKERLPYTNTLKSDKYVNTISYFLMDAPAKDFFEVPEIVTIETDDGEAQIPVGFVKVLRRAQNERGMVLVDPKYKGIISEEDNVALTKEEAKRKGDIFWDRYLRKKADEWFRIVEEAKVSGRLPQKATGFFKFVLDELHIADPADTIGNILDVKRDLVANNAVQAQIARQEAVIAAQAESLSRLEGMLAVLVTQNKNTDTKGK